MGRAAPRPGLRDAYRERPGPGMIGGGRCDVVVQDGRSREAARLKNVDALVGGGQARHGTFVSASGLTETPCAGAGASASGSVAFRWRSRAGGRRGHCKPTHRRTRSPNAPAPAPPPRPRPHGRLLLIRKRGRDDRGPLPPVPLERVTAPPRPPTPHTGPQRGPPSAADARAPRPKKGKDALWVAPVRAACCSRWGVASRRRRVHMTVRCSGAVPRPAPDTRPGQRGRYALQRGQERVSARSSRCCLTQPGLRENAD